MRDSRRRTRVLFGTNATFFGTQAILRGPVFEVARSGARSNGVEKRERVAETDGVTLRLRFADCTFDTETRGLLRAGRPVPLSENAAAVLTALLQRSPRPVSNVELGGT